MKRNEVKVCLIIIMCAVFQSFLYVLAKGLSGDLTLLSSNIDNRIYFNIWGIIPYSFWYFLIMIIPYYFYKKDKNLFVKYIVAYIFMAIVADIIFISYPTTVARPEIVGNSILHVIARIIFNIDNPPINCFPSLHCATSMIWIMYAVESKTIKWKYKLPIILVSLLIILSTLIVKQHVLIDVAGGIILAVVTYIVIILVNKTICGISRHLKI